MDPKPLSRAQLAKICNNDPEAIRLFERLFKVAGESLPNQIDGNAAANFGNAMVVDPELGKAVEAQELALVRSELAAVVQQLQDMQLTLDPPRREFRRACYGQFYSTATQTAAAIGTAYPVTFTTTDLAQGVFLSGSRVTVTEGAVYDFQATAQIDKTSGGVGHFYVWFAKNGANIANSASTIRIQGNTAEVFLAVNLLIPMAAGDYVELRWSVDDVTVAMTAVPETPPVPGIPSVILTVSNNIEGVK